MALEVSNRLNICFKCGMAYGRRKGTFFVSHSILHKGIGYLPYCMKCVDVMYGAYLQEVGNARDAVRQICRKLDLYWNPTILERVEKTAAARSVLAGYISSINGVKYAGMCYDDTLREENAFWNEIGANKITEEPEVEDKLEPDPEPESEPDVEINPEFISFWGSGFSLDFYDELNQRYADWSGGVDVTDVGERALYKQICILEVTINRDTAAGKPIDKNVNALNALLGSANLKPLQKKKEESSAGFDATPFGVWIRRWENEHPIPEDESESKIIKLVSTWLFGHLGKLFGIKNIHSTLYEEAIEKYKVEMPELEDEDDDTILATLFGDNL